MTSSATKITRIVTLGDSLSDRGTLDKRKLLGLLPMSYLSGLSSKSPRGRFTNGFLWGDFVSATTAEQFEIDRVRKKLKVLDDARANADIADEFIANDHELRTKNEQAFSLNDDEHVLFNGERFARYYCEGGLTAHDYFTDFTFKPTEEFSRLILSTLDSKREELFADDKKYKISQFEKSETLVVEWSGANDLITVNSEPSNKEADKAVAARIRNIEEMVANGYRNFSLFNLPDLSLTPRFQVRDQKSRDNASKCSTYFNYQLEKQCQALNEKYKKLHIPINLSVFDINGLFSEVYANPEEYEFDKQKLKTPYTQSEEFKQNEANPVDRQEHISPSKGYMFWDDVHPTAEMHAWLAVKFQAKYTNKTFKFEPPKPSKHLSKSVIKEEGDKPSTHSLSNEDHKKVHLPDDVAKILKTLFLHAQTMCRSTNPERIEKGEALKLFIYEIKSKNGNLEDIHGVISSFRLNDDFMSIIKRHNNPWFDFFFFKDATQSEESIKELNDVVQTHLGQSLPLN